MYLELREKIQKYIETIIRITKTYNLSIIFLFSFEILSLKKKVRGVKSGNINGPLYHLAIVIYLFSINNVLDLIAQSG